MTATREIVTDQRDQFAFHDDIVYLQETKRGLTRETVEEISRFKEEPDWMLQYRLRAYDHFLKRPLPTWGGDLTKIDFGNIVYYRKPSEREEKSWDDVPDKIKETFERLGIPEAERKFLAGVGAQYDSEVVYHSVKEELTKTRRGLHGHRPGAQGIPRDLPQVLRHRRPGRGQQVLRAQRRSVVGWVIRVRPEGRRGPAPAAGLLPDQRREHRPVRAHADHGRRGCQGPLHRGLHGPDLRHRVPPRRGRRGHRPARRQGPLHDHPELVERRLQPRDQARPRARELHGRVDRREHRFAPDDEVSRRSTCAAKAPRRTSSAWRSPARVSTRTPVPRPSISRRTPARGSSSKSVCKDGGRATYRGSAEGRAGLDRRRRQRALRRPDARRPEPQRHVPVHRHPGRRHDDVARGDRRARSAPTRSST